MRTTERTTALLILAFLLAVNLPYAALIALFGYDDVLREPPGEVLSRFHAAGEPLVLAWLGFAAAAFAFAPIATRIERTAGLQPGWLGPASAAAQGLGLARWVFAVPGLAASYASGDAASQAAAISSFQALHGYLGAGVGEVLGQVLVALWSVRVGAGFLKSGRRLLGGLGLLSAPVWILGLSEPLATVLPSIPVIEAAPLAFGLWMA